MTHGRKKPRVPRPISANPFHTARMRATRLTAAEIAEVMTPMRACLKAVREGVAVQEQYEVLHSGILIAEAIESSGIVRGLADHITSALRACEAIQARAMRTGTWKPTALYFQELDALNTALDLHQYQIQQLSSGELHRIVQLAIARTQSAGGIVRRISEADLAKLAA